MERPDIRKPFIGPGKRAQLVARTQSLEEANRIAEAYELKGFQTHITKSRQGSVTLYEVWASREPDVFTMQGKTLG
jgi:hypothetical protein